MTLDDVKTIMLGLAAVAAGCVVLAVVADIFRMMQ
jgi:hypothetical protein